jgi:hypothetical protein
MSTSIEWTPPNTVTVGESIDVPITYSCDDGSCGAQDVGLRLDGTLVTDISFPPFSFVGTSGAQSIGEGVSPVSGGGWEINSTGSLVFTEPGDYTFEAFTAGFAETATVTVEPEPFDPSKVSRSCSITAPTDPSPGDSITLEATVTNDNSEAADVELVYSFGDATETTTITVPANSSTTDTQTFTPDEPATYSPSVDYSVLN